MIKKRIGLLNNTNNRIQQNNVHFKGENSSSNTQEKKVQVVLFNPMHNLDQRRVIHAIHVNIFVGLNRFQNCIQAGLFVSMMARIMLLLYASSVVHSQVSLNELLHQRCINQSMYPKLSYTSLLEKMTSMTLQSYEPIFDKFYEANSD